MFTHSRKIACFAALIILTACNAENNADNATDGFVLRVSAFISATRDDVEPVNVDHIRETMPENSEPVRIQ